MRVVIQSQAQNSLSGVLKCNRMCREKETNSETDINSLHGYCLLKQKKRTIMTCGNCACFLSLKKYQQSPINRGYE